ncbi:MAG: FMN-binding negative transcriptional regulator [Thermomicrobiales bacterium]|nr:FMN-binding negative transcriptional regulator [Thermomicrobiales bacterium]
MRHTPAYIVTDPEVIKRLIRENPWATFVSATSAGLTASHYPILLEEDTEGISIVSHFGRPDDELHCLGEREMLVIVQGPHGYISPSWYGGEGFIPTWDHSTAHLYGTPELLSPEENYAVLSRLVDHFEQHVAHPCSLSQDEATARHVATGTTGLRLRVTRFDARLKLSQNKPLAVRENILAELDAGDTHPYQNRPLAREFALHSSQLSATIQTASGDPEPTDVIP